jgi:hypothetical protein
MTDPLRPDQPVHDPAAETSVTPVPTASHTVGTPAAAAASDPAAGSSPLTPPAASTEEAPVPLTATQPVGRGGRTRWLAAAAVVGAVAIASAAIGIALTSSSGQGTVAGYVPADSLAYAEIRLDLPGDQRAEVAEFLSKFPGFADQAALDTKVDEVLDRLVSEGTDGQQTFSADIKPWFDGELAVSSGPLPDDLSTLDDPEALGAKGRTLALISIKDEALARAWFESVLAENGVSGTTETYGDTTITTFPDAMVGKATPAYAIIDARVAVAGDIDSVKAAIDTNGSSGFTDQDGFQAATQALEGDSVGFAYVAMGQLVDSAASAVPGQQREAIGALVNLVPDWAAFRLRIEGDAMLMDSATADVEGAPGPDTDRTNGVAAWAPPTTIALAASNDVGATVDETIELYRAQPGAAEVLEQIEEAAGMLGGLEGILGWMGDTGVIVTATGETPGGALVSIPTDADAASRFVTTIRSFAALGGSQLGITVTDEDYAGTTITTVDLGSLDDLAGMAGALGGAEAPTPEPGSLPSDPVRIAFAASDGVVVIGTGPDVVKAVLDAGPGPSLADDGRYQAAVGRVGNEHASVSYVDLAAVRTLIEAHLDEATAEERAEYEESIQPFLAPFDTFAAAMVVGGDVDETHAVVTVK